MLESSLSETVSQAKDMLSSIHVRPFGFTFVRNTVFLVRLAAPVVTVVTYLLSSWEVKNIRFESMSQFRQKRFSLALEVTTTKQ